MASDPSAVIPAKAGIFFGKAERQCPVGLDFEVAYPKPYLINRLNVRRFYEFFLIKNQNFEFYFRARLSFIPIITIDLKGLSERTGIHHTGCTIFGSYHDWS
jgi:hypothetical protein